MSKPRDNSGQIFWGLFLVAAGAFLLLSRLGITDLLWTMERYWPVIVIIVGASQIVHRKTVWSGLSTVTIGAWLQLVTLHLYGFTYRSSWPFLLVILGGGIIVRSIAEAARRRSAEEGERHV
jgi:cell wall-active antibiotic response 4TMS protein YvqF